MTKICKQKGNALAGTMMFLLLVMIMWLGVTRQMATYMRMEKNFQTQKEFNDGPVRAMSWALTLLETGNPPATPGNPYSCTLQAGSGSLHTYVITYEETSHDNYRITARPAVSGDESLPVVPQTFHDHGH
jgi:Tfp pilus assembly protein PilX